MSWHSLLVIIISILVFLVFTDYPKILFSDAEDEDFSILLDALEGNTYVMVVFS